MIFVTFYSYKGGVGRTMTLLNAARSLARSKRSVFLIDLDLEAPGFENFDLFKNENKSKGFVDYLTEYLETGDTPSLDGFYFKAQKINENEGDIYVMPAGLNDESYTKKLSNINWLDIYRNKNGSYFINSLKEKIKELEKEKGITFSLVDSRTGFSDIGGISSHQIADVVVLVFNINDQNYEGIKKAYTSIRKYSDRNINIILALSPIPLFGGENISFALDERLEAIKKDMGDCYNSGNSERKPIVIEYHPSMAIREMILVDEEAKYKNLLSKQLESYNTLTSYIKELNIYDFDSILKKAIEFNDKLQKNEAKNEFERLISLHNYNPKSWFEYGKFLYNNDDDKEKGVEYLIKSVDLDQNNYDYLDFTINALINNKNSEKALIYLEKFENLKKDDGDFYFYLGLYSQKIAKLIENDDKNKAKFLYEKIFEYYQLALDKKYFFVEYIMNNLGSALSNYAKLIENEDKTKAIGLYEESIKKCEKAIELNNNYSNAYYNLSICYTRYYRLTKNKDLLYKALENSQKSEEIEKYSCLYNIACVYALLQDKENAFKYLEEIIKIESEKKEYCQKDRDWAEYYDDPEFKRIVGG